MKIEVTREIKDGILTILIKCEEPSIAPLKGSYKNYLNTSKNCVNPDMNNFPREVIGTKIFTDFKNELRRFFLERCDHISEEVYNFVLDAQEGDIKEWVESWAAGRSRYYFDNDRTIENCGDDDECYSE